MLPLISLLVLASSASAPIHTDATKAIQHHLLLAEEVLQYGDEGRWSEAQLEARRRNLERLRAYRARGEFPQNRDFRGAAVPYFRDARGVLCAMGHLIWLSGDHDLVDRIAASRNNATVHALADEPGLAEWLDANGLTLEEAARVQPGYPDMYAYEVVITERPATALPVGACSDRLALELRARDGGSPPQQARGQVYASSYPEIEVRFFSDGRCEDPLADAGEQTAALDTDGGFGAFYFRSEAAGTAQIGIYFDGPSATHQARFEAEDAGVSEDGGMAQFTPLGLGCSTTGPGLSLFAVVGAIFVACRRKPLRGTRPSTRSESCP